MDIMNMLYIDGFCTVGPSICDNSYKIYACGTERVQTSVTKRKS